MYAAVLEDGSHDKFTQPQFEVLMMTCDDGKLIPCGQYNIWAGNGSSQFFAGSGKIQYTNWTTVSTDLTGYIGRQICITFRVRDCMGNLSSTNGNYSACSGGGHRGYAYVDTYCKPVSFTVPEFCANASTIQVCAPPGYLSYSWPSGQPGLSGSPTTQCVTISNPIGGTVYTVNMQSVTGCPVTLKVPIKAIPVTKSADTTTICAGSSASLTVNATGTNGPYSYTWSNGLGNGTSVTVNPTSTTTYTVTVTNKDGCTSTELFTVIANPCGPAVTATGGPVCPGGCYSLTATGSGGASPYTYAWSGGLGSGAGPKSACPGATTTYTVTVTDNTGLTATDTAIVTILVPPVSTTSKTDVSCFGGTNGSATAVPTGGSSPYTYVWSPMGGTGAITTSNLSPGTYTVTTTDNKGCSSTSSVTVGQPTNIVPSTTAAPANCGASNGSVTVSASGGTAPYTYAWAAPLSGTGTIVNNVSGGTYTVTVTDNKGCTKTASVTVSSTGGATVTAGRADAKCFGSSDGSATATGLGGTLPYTYSWSPLPASGNNSIVSNLPFGTYTVTLTDAQGCISTASVSVGQPPAINAITTKADANCGGSDGSATVTASGGSGGFSYQWTGGPASGTYPNVPQGIYTVRITDSNGCTKDTTVTVGNNNPVINLSLTKSDANCGGSDGSATVTASGGSGAPYSYQWTGGPASGTYPNIAQGIYTVRVTDSKGCTKDTTVSVGDVGSPTLSINATTLLCNGDTTAAITSTVSGGVPPYTYSWNTGSTTLNLNNRGAGTYILTVTGQNGCKATQQVTIAEPSAMNATTSNTNSNCNQSDGSVSVTVSGGTGSYSYSWSNSATTAAVNNIPAGGYTVTIRDANGCSITAAANVTDIGAPSVTATKVDILCNGLTTGSATSTVTSGIAPYTYTWSNGSTTTSLSNVSAGTYILTVTANNGCKATTQVTITEPTLLVLTIQKTDEVCGNGTGTATVAATGATPAYSYLWSTGGTSDNLANLNAGTYTATVTDNNGCSKTIATTVSNIATFGPTATFTLDPSVTEILAPTIRFFDQTTGATTWHWDFGDGTTLDSVPNPSHTYQDTGTYTICLTITNQYGCTSTECHSVTIKPIWSFYIPNAFTPDGDKKNDTFNGKGIGIKDYELYIFDRWGDLIFKSNSLATDWDGRANNGSIEAQEDVYVYVVKLKDPDGKKHRYTGSVTLVR